MVAQGVLPFQYEEEKRPSGMTALAGLPLYLELFAAIGLGKLIHKHLRVRPTQGWSDVQLVSAMILLNLVGADCVDDLAILEADAGFGAVLRRMERYALSSRERVTQKHRWRKERTRAAPSASAVFRYLDEFHDEGEEQRRQQGKAFIPVPNGHLLGLRRANAGVVAFVQRRAPRQTATLDMDATVVETHKREALYCYKKFRAYQPLNVYWAEQQLLVHSEFRDGNVPAGHEQLRVLRETLVLMPPGVTKVFMRSDSAGYQWELLKYCAEGKDKRFGVIKFAVAADVTKEFKIAVAGVREEDWRPVCRELDGERHDTGQQWTEVCFVPQEAARKKEGPSYRFLAIREPLAQLELPCTPEQCQLPFPTMDFGEGRRYKLFGLVTNRDLPGEELIWWHRQRCGKSEEAHAVMKHDLAGGQLPCAKFGANAAWWAIMILAFNLHSAMKRLVLGAEWENKRLKSIRLALIHLPGRVIHHARRLVIRLPACHPSFRLVLDARRTILALAQGPPTG